MTEQPTNETQMTQVVSG